MLFHTRVPMVATGTAEEGLKAVVDAIHAVFAERPEAQKSLAGIGVCSPGPLDPRKGVVINPPNLPCWRNYPLADELRRDFNVPVRVDNDANAAGLAEAIWGAGIGYRDVFYTTIGTGIGTGIVFDRKIYHGRTGSAAEGGHVTIDYHGPRCTCGKMGCIEIQCAGPAIARRARAHLTASGQKDTKILELAGGDVEKIHAEAVGEAFRQGDPLARQVLRETADLLTVWIGSIVDLLEPEVMIFGGGVSELMSEFFGYMKENLPKWCINPHPNDIPMVRAKYGSDAGVAGGAALCRM